MMWFFIAFAVILLLILFIPINLDVFYKDNFFISVKVLFFKFVIPLKKSKSKKKPSEQKKTKINKGLDTKLSELYDVFKTVKAIVFRSVTIKLFKADVVVCTGDPCNTALLYGSVNALCYAIYDLFFGFTKIKKSDINISADYNGDKTKVVFNIIINTYLFKFIVSLIKALADGKIKSKEQ